LGNEAYEHISLHEGLRKAGYRIFINCALVNSTHHIDLPPPLQKTERWQQSNFYKK
jgi:hypothetical protein